MKRAKGFTLVELVIVIVIVGILSIVAVPIYRGYTRKAMASEGKALLGTIQTSERVIFAETAQFLQRAIANTGIDTELDVDARANKYFKTFSVSANANAGTQAAFTAVAHGSGNATGINLTMTVGSQSEPKFSDTGLNA